MKSRYRVVIECEVETQDMTPERMLEIQAEREEHMKECESCRLAGPEDMPSDESLAEQRALRKLLVEDRGNLDRWMRREILLQLAEHGLEAIEPDDTEEEILRPVIEKLPAVLRHRYREALARGELYETAPEFYESFIVRVRSVGIDPK